MSVSPLSLLFLFPILYTSHRLLFKKRKTDRNQRIPYRKERVIILGSSSGIGRVIANKYAKRGAYVCVVGRREDKVAEVVEECRTLIPSSERSLDLKNKILGFAADIADVDAMENLRGLIENEWGGVDTLIVAAGVSAVKPLLSIAYSQSQNPSQVSSVSSDSVQSTGVHRVVSAASAAVRGNYIGPLVAATTFIPLLSLTSSVPSIHLISSLASVVPAPTRSLYGSTKSASLILYQSLSIEHPNIHWSYVLPSTVQGNFRAGAVDVFPDDDVPTTSTMPLPTTSNVTTPGLSSDRVADTSIRAIDTQDSRPIFIPSTMRYAHWLYWIWPGFVEERARRKYGFTT